MQCGGRVWELYEWVDWVLGLYNTRATVYVPDM